MKMSKQTLLLSTTLIALTAVSSQPVFAQSSDDNADEIVVTGSRISRKDLISTSPVKVIGEADLDLSGFNQVATILNELPQAGVPGLSDTSSNFSSTGTGASTIDLRNLGTNRTLILVNGRRHIGGLAGSPTVDVSMIPAPLIKRVEVVTGGASAVYGSEAVAGVINFITKDDFEGLELEGRYGTSEAGGATDVDINLTAGSSFDNGRGNAVIYAGYSDRGVLSAADREVTAADATNSSFGPASGFILANGDFLTLDRETGFFDKEFVSAEDGFNRNARRLIRVPTERYQFNANLNYDINENVSFFSESAYSNSQSVNSLEPTIVGQFISVGSIPNINMPLNNAFFPSELMAAALAADPDATEVTFRRRFTELGNRSSDTQRQVFRTAAGLRGDIDENWSYEAYAQYGTTTQDQVDSGVFNTASVLQALTTEADPDNLGSFRCVDQLARDLGCVPVNFFGLDTVTGAALDFVSVSPQTTSRAEQYVVSGFVTGDLFDLPAGAIGSVLGVEYREEQSDFNPDALAASGLTSGNALAPTSGGYNVTEVFGELLIPLLADKPYAQDLTLELAGRHADYSTVGAADAYKIALSYTPVEGLKLRGGYNTAVRAPFIDELFDPGSETFRSFNDPCALGGVGGPSSNTNAPDYIAQTAVVQANCATIPGTATLDPAGTNIQSAGGLAAGNSDLTEEVGSTFTLGLVYTPSFIDNLNVTVDYFDISIDDAIASFSAQDTVDQCVRQPDFPSNAFCDLIQRDSVTGLVQRIDALAINVATFETSGIDFAADYSFDFKKVGFRFNLNGTYLIDNNFLPFEGGEIIDNAGEIGSSDWKINGTLVASWDNWQVGWSTRFIDGANIDNDNLERFGTVSSEVYNDINVEYSVGNEERYSFYAGVDNIFDAEPPFLGQGTPGDVTGTNTAADVYDAIGRSVYVGVRARF